MDDRTIEARSFNMSRIRSKHTSCELTVRRLLHSLGYRFRLHYKDLAGCPDIVMKKYNAAIFVHGCFWHVHRGCRFAAVPKSNASYWLPKLQHNAERDIKARDSLIAGGWRVLWVWECGVKQRSSAADLETFLTDWLSSGEIFSEYPPAANGPC